jgi:hypothetical protein
MGGTCGMHGGGRGVYRVLVGRLEGKRPLGGPRLMWWEDNIKLDPREIEIDGTMWIRLAQDRVRWRAFLSTVMNLQFHKESRLLFDKRCLIKHSVSKTGAVLVIGYACVWGTSSEWTVIGGLVSITASMMTKRIKFRKLFIQRN